MRSRRSPQEGPGWLYGGELGERICDWVCERGGLLSPADFAAYEVIERAAGRGRLPRPARAHQPAAVVGRHPDRLRARPAASGWGDPPPLDDPDGLALLAEVMAEAQPRAGGDFHERLHEERLRAELPRRSARGARRPSGSRPGSRPARAAEPLGSTTHISVLDADGNAASVTCSNGTGSGVMAPGTGVHLNNMLGEEDLNPLGFHLHEPGTRVTSMMAPTIVLRDGEVELALGSAGSNRLRSAILQVIRYVVDYGMDVAEAVRAGRLHYEAGDAARRAGLQRRVARRARAPRLPGRALEGAEPLLRRRAGGAPRPVRRASCRAPAIRAAAASAVVVDVRTSAGTSTLPFFEARSAMFARAARRA